MRLPLFLVLALCVNASAEPPPYVLPPKLEFKGVASEWAQCVSPDGTLFATGDPSGVNVWKFGDTKPLAHIAWGLGGEKEGEVLPQTFSRDNKLLLIARRLNYKTQELAVADIEMEKILGALPPRRLRFPDSSYKGLIMYEGYLRSFFSTDNTKVSFRSGWISSNETYTNEEIVFTPAGKVLETKSWKDKFINRKWVDESSDGHALCYRNAAGVREPFTVRVDEGSCAVLNCETGKRVSYLDECDAAKIENAAMSYDMSRVIGHSKEKDAHVVAVWEAATGKIIRRVVARAEPPYREAYGGYATDVNGRYLAFRTQHNGPNGHMNAARLDLVSLDTGERLGRIETASDPARKFDPEIKALANDASVAYMFVRANEGDRGTMNFWRFGPGRQVAPVADVPVAPPSPAFDVDRAPKTVVKTDPNAFAVVIGVERYRAGAIPAVNYASRDAKAMYNYLTQSMGFDAKNVVSLTDGEATKTDFDKNFGRWLKNRVDAKSRVFVYYAGHGAPNPTTGEGYLMPYEADPSYLDETAYPVARLYAELAKLPTKDVTVVLDACFSGQGQRSLIATGTRPLVVVKSAKAPQSLLVIAAASGAQVSASDPVAQHGLLTYHLLSGLQGAADADKDGSITANEIFAYAQPAVERAARLQNIEQTPSISRDASDATRPWITFEKK